MEPASLPRPTEVPLPSTLAQSVDGERDYLLPLEIAEACRADHLTVLRWINTGITIRDAQGKRIRVRLRGHKIGGRWKVPIQEFEAFVRATTGAALPEPTESRETEAERKARVERCMKRLADAGMLT
jgi:hypothetical protein